MTGRDLWEYITFQSNWEDTNIFIILIGNLILILLSFGVLRFFTDILDDIAESRRQKELHKSLNLGESKKKEPLKLKDVLSVIWAILLVIVFLYIWITD